MAKENTAARKTGSWGGMAAVCFGIGLVGLAVFLALSFTTGDIGIDPAEAAKTCWTGLLGAYLAFGGLNTIGRLPCALLTVLIACWGAHIARSGRFLATWPQMVGGVLAVVACALGVCAFSDTYDMASGGLVALYLSPAGMLYFGRWGMLLAAAGVMFLGILLAFGESAVAAAHGTLAAVRGACAAVVSLFARMFDLLKLLFAPRIAPAGMPAGKQVPEGDSMEDESSRETPAAVAAPAARAAVRAPVKEFKPRESFQSRYLSLDLRDDTPSAAAEGVNVAIAASDFVVSKRTQVADVIMDVDAEEEESDVFVSAPPPPAARPPAPAAAAKPQPPPAPAKAGAYGAEKPARDASAPSGGDLSRYALPPLSLLDPPEPPVVEDMGEITARAKILEQTLATFKIEGKVVHIERGPRVTMYEISLAPGIRLNKVTSLADNIAMQLQAESVRIIAPIPGKNTIGIEIPNSAKELVSLSEIVTAVNREKKRQALPVCLGKDVSGQPLIADLARMPHLLIAGATGSGKSVCINSIILSVMMCCRPDEAQMIMVDPKVVELSRFKDIPHLMSPVITDMKRAVAVLEWICRTMDERYEMMSQVSVNNIAKFNALGEQAIRERLDEFAGLEEIEAFPKSMPYMVVIIDELADLMMVAGKEVEQHITRLAAKSRAVGIHLILATQRPSVDVITGLIKANMPCRIAFQVASRVDSRTILDQNGAETLLGQGDMLYLPPGVGKLARAQGVFVSDEELFRVVEYTKSEAEPQYHADLLGPVIGGGGKNVDVSAFDELFVQAGQEIIQNQRGSVSLLQRKFGIGYGRASRIIDQLATVGLLGPFRDGKAREILLTMEEFTHKFGGAGGGGDWSDDDDGGGLAGLRDDERERPQPDYGDPDDDRPF